MNLRTELLPPVLDEELVARLARLADELDGNPDEVLRSEFNQLAGTDVPMINFQGVYGSGGHASFVRRLLRKQLIKPVPEVTQGELIEIVRRAMKIGDSQEAYMDIFDANVPRRHASNLIFYPPDYDHRTNTWAGGRPVREYDPTAEQIVEWALAPN